MDKLVAKFFNYSCKGLNLHVGSCSTLIHTRSHDTYPDTEVCTCTHGPGLGPVPVTLDMQDSYPYPYPCHCTHTCTHGLRHRYTQDQNYSTCTNKVSKKTVIVPHFFVCLFLVLDAGENFWNLDKKIDGTVWRGVRTPPLPHPLYQSTLLSTKSSTQPFYLLISLICEHIMVFVMIYSVLYLWRA